MVAMVWRTIKVRVRPDDLVVFHEISQMRMGCGPGDSSLRHLDNPRASRPVSSSSYFGGDAGLALLSLLEKRNTSDKAWCMYRCEDVGQEPVQSIGRRNKGEVARGVVGGGPPGQDTPRGLWNQVWWPLVDSAR